MAIYFCINEMLDQMEQAGHLENRWNTLVSIQTAPAACNGFKVDAFIVEDTPRILDLNSDAAAEQIAVLAHDVPLYRINVELALDNILADRHGNAKILAAIIQAFGDEALLPNTMQLNEGKKDGDHAGSLRHPMLGHTDTKELCRLYATFLRLIGPGHNEYNFKRNVLGTQYQPFLQYFDGFTHGGEGMARASYLLVSALRKDHKAGRLESYVENGKANAESMAINDTQELVWAWLEADDYQRRRCLDLHRILSMNDLPRLPDWVRYDAFSLLAKEAMKQVFAANLQKTDSDFLSVNAMPSVKKAMTENAQGHISESLQQLLSQVLNIDTAYTGPAEKFARQAAEREQQAQKVRVI